MAQGLVEHLRRAPCTSFIPNADHGDCDDHTCLECAQLADCPRERNRAALQRLRAERAERHLRHAIRVLDLASIVAYDAGEGRLGETLEGMAQQLRTMRQGGPA